MNVIFLLYYSALYRIRYKKNFFRFAKCVVTDIYSLYFCTRKLYFTNRRNFFYIYIKQCLSSGGIRIHINYFVWQQHVVIHAKPRATEQYR